LGISVNDAYTIFSDFGRIIVVFNIKYLTLNNFRYFIKHLSQLTPVLNGINGYYIGLLLNISL